MNNKKLTDNEIIKALECCEIAYDQDCTECPLYPDDGEIACREVLREEALDLITRQQAELENLKVENQSLRTAGNSLKMHYEEAQAKIERLNAENMLTISERNAFRTSFYDVLKQLKIARSEAVKEFTKRLKEFMHNKFKALDEYEFEYITERDIDNFVKETETERGI